MKLQQLRYIWEVSRNDLNISAAALALYTSQPGVSKQIRLLEDELELEIFTRNGKHLTKVTPAGKQVLELAGEILNKVDGIKKISRDHKSPTQGTLSIATTHTQARYFLPDVIKDFIRRYPDVTLNMVQGSTSQITQAVVERDVDFTLITEEMEPRNDLVVLPCYRYSRVVLVPKGHPLSQLAEVSLDHLAGYPLLTHVFNNADAAGVTTLGKAFEKRGLKPKIVFSAVNADVIKAYVRAGLGVAVVSNLAYSDDKDSDLVSISVPHLFDSYLASLVVRKSSYLRGYMYDFIEGLAPHLTRQVVDEVMSLPSPEAQVEYFINIDIPTY
jgi:LysR family transcriptional regulator, cys regulon transcriptional activator